MINAMRHLPLFNPKNFVDREVHILGTNLVARSIAYLVAKLGCDNLHFHTFRGDSDAVKSIASYADEMSDIKAQIHVHQGTNYSGDIAVNNIVFVAEEIHLRPDIYRNLLETSMGVEVVFDVRLSTDNNPLIHTLKSEDLFRYDELYVLSNSGWEEGAINPIVARMLAIWTVNQFITWTQQTDQLEGKEDRVTHAVQPIKPSSKILEIPILYNPHDSCFAELKEREVTIIGVGATGSHLVDLLAESGFRKILVYDFDQIESHNIANQWFREKQIGTKKVAALGENTEKYHGIVIEMRDERVAHEQRLSDIVFLLTDSMKSRKEIANNLLQHHESLSFLIETRMAAEIGQIYAVDDTQDGGYQLWFDTLFDAEVVKPEVSACGTSITIATTAMLCATYAVNQLLHAEAGRQNNKPIPTHSVFADMYPPYAIFK